MENILSSQKWYCYLKNGIQVTGFTIIHHSDFEVRLYLLFINEIFSFSRCPLLLVHRKMKQLSTNYPLKSDIKIPCEYKFGIKFDLCITEVKKKSNIMFTSNHSDYIKMDLEMKLMLDVMVKMNINESVVFGLLIQGFECHLSHVTLQGGGFYVCPVVQHFHLPRDISDILLVLKVTSVFSTMKHELDQPVQRIQNKQNGKPPLFSLVRPSYSMPVLIKDRLQHILDNN